MSDGTPTVVPARWSELLWPALREQLRLAGPLFYWDVVRLARRGRGTLLRAAFAFVLAAALCISYASYFTYGDVLAVFSETEAKASNQDLSAFSRNFVTTTLFIQGIAVFILVPPYLGSAITEEKERKTLELLFTTHLYDREILTGKLLARVVHLTGILLGGLPVLALAQLWGGVDLLLVAVILAATFISLLSMGSVSVLASVQNQQSWSAILMSYLLVGMLATGCGCLPVTAYFSSPGLYFAIEHEIGTAIDRYNADLSAGLAPAPVRVPLIMLKHLLIYALLNGIVAAVCVTWAVMGLRRTALRAKQVRPRGQSTGGWDIATPRPARGQPRQRMAEPKRTRVERTGRVKPRRARSGRRPPIGNWALLWKEAYRFPSSELGGLLHVMAYLVLASIGIQAVFIFVFSFDGLSLYDLIQRYLNPSLRVATIVLTTILCIAVAFRAAGSFSRERDQQTLESLLLLPIDRWELVGAKWLGSILALRGLLYVLLVLWGIGLLTLALHPVSIILLALAVAIHVGLLASIGVWLSLVARNTVSAYFTMALMLMLLFLGSWLVLTYIGVGGPTSAPGWELVTRFIEVGLNPAATWWYLGANFSDMHANLLSWPPDFWQTLVSTVAGLAVFALLGYLLWQASCRRLADAVPPKAKPTKGPMVLTPRPAE